MSSGIGKWSEAQVAQWLVEHGFEEHVEMFKENDINGELLLELTHDLLKELGLSSMGKRMKLLKELDVLRAPHEFVGISTPASVHTAESDNENVVSHTTEEKEKPVAPEVVEPQLEVADAPASPKETTHHDHTQAAAPSPQRPPRPSKSLVVAVESKAHQQLMESLAVNTVTTNASTSTSSSPREALQPSSAPAIKKEETSPSSLNPQCETSPAAIAGDSVPEPQSTTERQAKTQMRLVLGNTPLPPPPKASVALASSPVQPLSPTPEPEAKAVETAVMAAVKEEAPPSSTSSSERPSNDPTVTRRAPRASVSALQPKEEEASERFSQYLEKEAGPGHLVDSEESGDEEILPGTGTQERPASGSDSEKGSAVDPSKAGDADISLPLPKFVPASSGDAKKPLIASALRAEKLTIDGKPFEIRKGELFIVLEMGDRWKVKPMERRWNDIHLPQDLLQIDINVFYKMQEQYGKKVFSPEGDIQLQNKGKKSIISMSAKDLKNQMMSGYLMKIGATLVSKKVWRRRWCVLHEFVLYYYETPEDEFALGKVPLPGYAVSIVEDFGVNSKKFCFKVSHPNARTYVFAAPNKEEMDKWVRAIGMSTVMEKGSSK